MSRKHRESQIISTQKIQAQIDRDIRQWRLNALNNQTRRIDRRLAELSSLSESYTRWRVLAFLGGFAAAFAGFAVNNWLGTVIALAWIAVFSTLVRLHRRVKRSLDRHRTWQTIRRTHLARMNLDWDRIPESVAAAPPEHPYATDLDIVGSYSMHRLLDTAVSRGGSDRLLGWLLDTQPKLETVDKRRGLVAALKPLATFRDRLTQSALLSGHRGKWDGQWLLSWLRSERSAVVSPRLFAVVGILAAANWVLIGLDALNIAPELWRYSLVAYIVVSGFALRKSGTVFNEALALKSELDKLNAVLGFLERDRYAAHPELGALCAPFTDPTRKPSTHLRRLNAILAASSVRNNAVAWLVLNVLFPWDLYFAAQLDRSKGQLGTLLPMWLDAWYELEALNALANFAWLNPDYTFVEINPTSERLEAQHMGHPLIPAEVRVCNDFALSGPGDVVIVTGSNMSGKSSFLRTIGVNLVLAYTGSVVSCAALHTGMFRLFTCIRVADSVVDGISYFYAEVKRLKALLAALRDDSEIPLLFLIDEIFRGTNNRERLIGSRSYIRALVGGNGCGLISTHDLELVRLADEVPQIRNVHFREDVVDGRMSFDYCLHPGPSPTTNALRIMALEGLPVESSDNPLEDNL